MKAAMLCLLTLVAPRLHEYRCQHEPRPSHCRHATALVEIPLLSHRNLATRLPSQDYSSIHSSPPYRAPELWDPPTGGFVTEKTDSEGRLLAETGCQSCLPSLACDINPGIPQFGLSALRSSASHLATRPLRAREGRTGGSTCVSQRICACLAASSFLLGTGVSGKVWVRWFHQ